MPFKAVIFDIDGTLVDTNEAHARCWIEIFRRYGREFDYDLIFHQLGKGGDLLVPDLLTAREIRTFGKELEHERGELWKRDYMPHVRAFPGVKSALQSLHASGIRLALGSSGGKDEVAHYIDLLDIADLLTGSTSREDAEHSKPSPEIFQAAMKRTGTDEHTTIAVGDTPYDILAAHRSGMAVAAVLCGGFERELLSKAEFVLEDVPDFLRKIDRLMPTSAIDLHHRAIIIDGHCDTPYRLFRHGVHLDDRDPDAQADLRSLMAGGVTASFFASYVPPHYAGRGAAAFAHKLIDSIHEEARRNPGHCALTVDSTGIRAAKAAGRLALMIGVEGGHAIEDSLDTLRDLYARGARYLTLTHVNTNNWCDSSGDAGRHGGLTDFGRDVVRTMNDIGMIVDVSHISDAAFFQVLETSRVPVVATHSSCRAICRHPRNMTDDMLRALALNGGVCMINFFAAFISDDVARVMMESPKRIRHTSSDGGNEEMPDDAADWDGYLLWIRSLGLPVASLEDVIDHILHAVSVAGVDHVGIGTDFDGVPALPEGLETVASLPGITKRLLERGLSEENVLKVLGGNFLRAFEQIEAGRR